MDISSKKHAGPLPNDWGPHPFRLLISICAMFVAGVGFVALLGWVLELPVLASLGSGMIPVAPSTAVMFVLYAGAIFLRTHFQKSRVTYWTGLSINSAGSLVALCLFILSVQGIQSEVEHLGFDIVHRPGETPVGHMSPITASCFLFSSLSYIFSLPSSRDRRRAANLAWWIACCIIAIGSTLILAYLYGTPMLYGSVFIPPAALTSMAFMALGAALLALAAPQAWPSRPDVGSTTRASYSFILVFVLLAAGIVIAGFLYYRNYEIRHRTEVERQLSAVADLKVDEIVHWRKERLGDAALFYKNLNFSELVRRYLQRPDDEETGRRLRTWLQHVREGYQYDRVFLLDAGSKERMSAPEARRPISRYLIQRSAEVLRTKQVALEDFYRNEYDRRVYLAVLIPILDERGNGRAMATLVFRIDPEQYFYPFLNRWPTPSQTAETLLVRREGNEVLFLNEPRFQKNTALNLRRSLDNKELPAAQAVLGRQGVMEGRDYQGVPVIADVRPVPDSPWFLVSRMDNSEVYKPMREKLWMMVALVGALLISAGGGVGLVWRRQRTEFYRERYSASEALRESEERFRILVEGVKDYAIIMLDPAGNVMSWNQGAERIKGYRDDEIIGRHFSRFYIEEDVRQGKPQRELDRAAKEGRFEEENWRIRKDGSRFWANVVIAALRDETGQLRGFSKVTRDITERKRVEKALQESETRLREAQKMAQLGHWNWDVRTGIVEWSEEVYNIFHLDPNNFTPHIDSILALSPWPEDHDRDKELIRKAMESHEKGNYEQRFLRPDGSIGYYYSTFQGKYDDVGNLMSMVGTVLDITERKKAEEVLAITMADLQRSNKDLEQFAYVASHDLQEPLRMVASYTQLLAERYENQLDDKAKKFIHYAVDGAVRMQQLINDLLAYSRIGTRGKPLEFVDAHTALGEAINNLKMNIDETKVIITNDELPKVRADASQLALLFQNLISNAVKFHGTEKPHIHISVRNEGRDWLFSVKDNGIGIEQQYADKIFIIFQRLHTREEYPGSGIGLAICKKIVERHGGRIWFESEFGKGATFYFTIPK